MNKKGAMELSINMIVIIVLAMTLLGLGVGLIKGFAAKMRDTRLQVLDQTKTQIQDDLMRSDKKIGMLDNELALGSAEGRTLLIGIKNMGDTQLNFYIKILDLNENSGTCTSSSGKYTSKSNRNGVDNACAAFKWDQQLLKLEPGEVDTYKIKIFAPKIFNSYMYKFLVEEEGGAEYTSSTFFVSIA
jgi:hypothetical protein